MTAASYIFGDIIDCRDKKTGVNHFIVILGKTDNNQYLYSIITSRVYKAFRELSNFLDGCKQKDPKCHEFERAFDKEKNNERIRNYIRLKDAYFLDGQTYEMVLTIDSMVEVNRDPEKQDIQVIEEWLSSGIATYRTALTDEDNYKLWAFIQFSEHISKDSLDAIRESYSQRATFILEREAKQRARKFQIH